MDTVVVAVFVLRSLWRSFCESCDSKFFDSRCDMSVECRSLELSVVADIFENSQNVIKNVAMTGVHIHQALPPSHQAPCFPRLSLPFQQHSALCSLCYCFVGEQSATMMKADDDYNVANVLKKSNIIPWEAVVSSLERTGMAAFKLPKELAEIHKDGFDVARHAFEDTDLAGCTPTYGPLGSDDESQFTGYHPPDPTSRYNAYREGFVFSNGRFDGDKDTFRPAMKNMFASLHNIALQVLFHLEAQWLLPKDWFQNTLGPTHDASQWHIKRYIVPKDKTTKDQQDKEDPRSNGAEDQQDKVQGSNAEDQEDKVEPTILLPFHKDPSLISVVVMDRQGAQPGGMGLQYIDRTGVIEVPMSGHAVAIIFIGNMLGYITGTRACPHGLLHDTSRNDKECMAATLLVRPRPDAALQVPPSPMFAGRVRLKKNGLREKGQKMLRARRSKKHQK